MSIPDSLWKIFHDDPKKQKLLIQYAYKTVKETMDLYCGGHMMPGALCVLHNFGRDLKKNCHIHMIVTEGGYRLGEWVRFTFFPYVKNGKIRVTINQIWMENVLEILRLTMPRTKGNARFIDGFRKRYPNGFYIHGDEDDRIKNNKSAYKKAKYITRYVRHPPISDNRIELYDGENVTFWFEMPSTKTRYHKTMPVLEFLYCVVVHMPDKGLHMFVKYGLYSTKYIPKAEIQNIFTDDGEVIDPKNLTWRQSMIMHFHRDPLNCGCCGKEMLQMCVVYKRDKDYKVTYFIKDEHWSAMGYRPEWENLPMLKR